MKNPKRGALLSAGALLMVVSYTCGAATTMLAQTAGSPGATGQEIQQGSASVPQDAASAPQRPNIVWILFDALRSHNLSCYGYERETSPTIDKIAAKGVLFEHHFSQGFWTEVSLPVLFSGRYFPISCTYYPSRVRVFKAPAPGEYLFTDIARANGYHTAMFTPHAALPPESRIGSSFDECHLIKVPIAQRASSQVPYTSFGQLNEDIFRWLESQKKRPFLLYIHLLDTHFPHAFDPPYDKWLDPNDASPSINVREGQPVPGKDIKFTEGDQRYMRGLYDGSLRYTDDQLSALLGKLEALGLRENTLLVLTSDHGDMLGEDGKTWGHGDYSWDWVMRVPFILSGPGVPEGKQVTALTENTDVVPTLVDLLGLETDAVFEGQNLMPLARGDENAPSREYVFAKFWGLDNARPAYILRDKAWKRIFDPYRDRQHLYRVPDETGHRKDYLEEEAEVAVAMRTIMEERFMPLWEAYDAREDLAITLPISKFFSSFQPNDAIVSVEKDKPLDDTIFRDGKWLLHQDRLWGAPWSEELPTLTLSVPVPNDRYLIQVRLISAKEHEGHMASSIRARVENDGALRTHTYVEGSSLKELYLDIGYYDVEDGQFDITIGTGEVGLWTIIDRFRLVPAAWQQQVSAEEISTREEQLRALGYLD